jgi:cytochrome c biogenesis protein CcmG/thiol:disulfide interchange protein DsbE
VKQFLRNVLVVLLLLGLPTATFAGQAPNFRLPGAAKSVVELSAFRGQVVYVDFWASWCDPCRKSFPWMGEIQKRYGKQLKVIAINLDQERDEANKFLQKNKPGFTVAFDPAGKTAEAYKVKGMPSSYVIDQQGRIISSHTGFRVDDKDKVEKLIAKLINNRK